MSSVTVCNSVNMQFMYNSIIKRKENLYFISCFNTLVWIFRENYNYSFNFLF